MGNYFFFGRRIGGEESTAPPEPYDHPDAHGPPYVANELNEGVPETDALALAFPLLEPDLELFASQHNIRLASTTTKSICTFDIVHGHPGSPYWQNHEVSTESSFGEIAHLRYVCWLEMRGSVQDVSPGRYLAYYRVKALSSSRFVANWRVGTGDRSLTQYARDTSVGPNEAVCFTDQNTFGGSRSWTYLLVGVFTVHTQGVVNMYVFGGNPNWTGEVLFDHVGLIRLQADWKIVRLMLIGLRDRASPLHTCNVDILRSVLEYL